MVKDFAKSEDCRLTSGSFRPIFLDVMHDTRTKPRPRRRRGPFPTLRAFFEQTGVRQSDIAANIGISESHMSNIVSGKRAPSLDVAKELSRETNVPVEAIGSDAP